MAPNKKDNYKLLLFVYVIAYLHINDPVNYSGLEVVKFSAPILSTCVQ